MTNTFRKEALGSRDIFFVFFGRIRVPAAAPYFVYIYCADAGMLLGAELNDGPRVVMVDDVTTSGKSIEETYPMTTSIFAIEVIIG